MIVNPNLSIDFITALVQNKQLRYSFYALYEDILKSGVNNNNSKENIAILLDSGVSSIIMTMYNNKDIINDANVIELFPYVANSAKSVSSDSKSVIYSADKAVQKLKQISESLGVGGLNTVNISSIDSIKTAASCYIRQGKPNENVNNNTNESIETVSNDEEVFDESEVDELAIDELAIDELASLAGIASLSASADKNEFDSDEQLEDVGSLSNSEMSYVANLTEAIMARYEMMLRPMLELDSPYGILYKSGLSTIGFDRSNNKITFNPGKDDSLFKILYDEINKYFNGKLVSGSLLNRPTVENISNVNSGYNYYPAMMLKYALGFADGKRHYNWDNFKKSAKKEVTKRIGLLAKAGLLPEHMARIQESFSNCILVTSCGNYGSNITMRICVANVNINGNGLVEMLKNNTKLSYFNSDIIVEHIGNDVIDLKIIGNMEDLLSVPTWAYQALQKQINSGQTLDSYSGLPIGKTFEGEIVKLTFIPAEDFITVIGAGSRSGKGVTTLSILGAAMNSGLGVLYNDYKPDMAKCFFDAEKKYPGLHTFTFDGLTSEGRADKNGRVYQKSDSIPSYAQKFNDMGGVLLYLKSLHLMCAIAQYKADTGDETPLLWVFDEIQPWQSTLASKISLLDSINPPKKGDDSGDELYRYAQKILEFVSDTDSGISNYITTTGGKSGIFTLWICQNTDAGKWSSITPTVNKRRLQLFGSVNKAGNMRKILGYGNTIGQYALGGFRGDPKFKNQMNYVSKHRFFAMFKGSQSDKNTEVKFFKPFLTLNTDDIYSSCWTGGIGKSYGYKPKNTGESDESYKARVLDKYENNLRQALPGNNKYGVSEGTGFTGLIGTYCNNDESQIIAGLSSGYEYIEKFMHLVGLDKKYSSIEEYLYDFSEFGFPSIGELQNYSESETYKNSISTNDESINENDMELGENGDGSFSFEDSNNDNIEIGNNNTYQDTDIDMEEPEINNYTNRGNRRFNSSIENFGFTRGFQESVPNTASNNNREYNDDDSNLDSNIDGLFNDFLSSLNNPDEEDLAKEQEFDNAKEHIKEQAKLMKELIKVAVLEARKNPDCSVKNGSIHTNNISNTEKKSNIISLDSNNSLNTSFGFGQSTLSNMVSQLGGQKYYDTRQFKGLLNAIGRKVNLKKVRMLKIGDNVLEIDGKVVMLNDYCSEDYGLIDIIEFSTLFKKIPRLQGLYLSQSMVRELIRSTQLGRNGIKKLFIVEPDLLKLYYEDALSGKEIEIDRDQYESEVTQSRVKSMEAEQELRERLDEQSILGGHTYSNDRGYMSKAVKAAGSAIKRNATSPGAKKLAKRTAVAVPLAVLAYTMSPILLFGGSLLFGVSKIAQLGKN